MRQCHRSSRCARAARCRPRLPSVRPRSCSSTVGIACFRLLPIASDCFRLRPRASVCFRVLPLASDCFRLLPITSDYFRLLPIASDCIRLLSNASARPLRRSPSFATAARPSSAIRLCAVPFQLSSYRPLTHLQNRQRASRRPRNPSGVWRRTSRACRRRRRSPASSPAAPCARHTPRRSRHPSASLLRPAATGSTPSPD